MDLSRFEDSPVMDFFTIPTQIVDRWRLDEAGLGEEGRYIETIAKVTLVVTAFIFSCAHFCFPTVYCFAVKHMYLDSLILLVSKPWELVSDRGPFSFVKKAGMTVLGAALVAGLFFSLSYAVPLKWMLAQYAMVDVVILSNMLAYTASGDVIGKFYTARFAGLFNTCKKRSVLNYTASRSLLRLDPLFVLQDFTQSLQAKCRGSSLGKVGTRITFEGEPGIDASGLSKDFYSTIFDTITAKKPLLDYTEEDLEVSNATFSLEQFYECCGFMMIHAGVQRNLSVGSGVRDCFFDAMHATVCENLDLFLDGNNDVAQRELQLKVIPTLLPYLDGSVASTITEQVEYLKTGNVTPAITTYAINTNRFYEMQEADDEIDEDAIEEDPSQHTALIKECIEANLQLLCGAKLRNFFTVMRGMSQALGGFGKHRALLEKMSPIDFRAHIAGVLDRAAIIKAIEVNITGERDSTEFLRKIELLKEWLEKHASLEDLKNYLLFFTGTSSFIPGHAVVTFSPTYKTGEYSAAHTCFNTGSLSGLKADDGSDATAEGFGRKLLASMGHASEGNTAV